MKWVRRNEDKPHRCPLCLTSALWRKLDHDTRRAHFGPRTRVWCPDCRVQWRMGTRLTRKNHLWWRRLKSGGMLPWLEREATFTWSSRYGRRRRGGKRS